MEEVIYLLYSNLHDLISGSKSSREYFLSLPVDTQIELHKQNGYIHSAADLHNYAASVKSYQHLVTISNMKLF